MRKSRRSWFAVVAALAGSGVRAAEQGTLPTKVSRFEDLAVNPGGKNRFRPIVEGLLHDGHPIEAHATELAPSSMPHGSHRHKHEEMFLIREGAVEVTVNGKSTRLGPGGVAFIASGEDHGIRNVGDTPAHYFVIALGRD
jgi:mannose-6-phosphate isomerase-like protein (cupin superfamily)